MKRKLLGLTGLVLTLGAGVFLYGQQLARVHPAPFFPYHASFQNLHLYSDEPFAEDDGRRILQEVAAKLAASTLYDPTRQHRAYVCNTPWRQRIFLPAGRVLGGVNYYPVTDNVYLGPAHFYSNRVVGSGRSLAYYIAHETAHTLVGIERGGYPGLPSWLNEGYADWVGLGPDFSYARAWRTYERRNPAYDQELSGRYLRYDVMVAHLLDRQKARIEDLMEKPPDAAEVERQAGLP